MKDTDGLGVHLDNGTDKDTLSLYCDRVGHSGREFTKDPAKVTCDACRHKLLQRGVIRPKVGMGATEIMYSDRVAFTVIAVSASGKTITVQGDIATRTDKNGMSESQSYEYARNPDGGVVTLRLTKRGWQSKGRRFAVGYRNAYHDYSF